jgi:8-oxo-dGTP pyrophosphatase MutT (NUDIX family)
VDLPMIEIETARSVHLAVPASIMQEGVHTDWDFGDVEDLTRPDFGLCAGNFVQFDNGSGRAHNTNGHRFVGSIEAGARQVIHTPMNMLHRRKHIVGSFVGSSVVQPGVATDAAKAMPYPYVRSLNTPRARKALNNPFFVGGAIVVPPALPGWRNADITRLTAVIEKHPDEAQQVFSVLAATQDHLSAAQAEFLMGTLLASALDGEELMGMSVHGALRMIGGFEKQGFTDDELIAGIAVLLDDDEPEPDPDDPNEPAEPAETLPIAAGVAVVAADSGRVLLLQRPVDPNDPASGRWEFPGGHLDPNETPWAAASREFCEEVGSALPDGQVVGQWTSPDGVYVGFVYLIASEADVDINQDHEDRPYLNPDADPDGKGIEVVAWWDPEHLPDMPALRDEVRESTDWTMINGASAMAPDDGTADALIDWVNRGSLSSTSPNSTSSNSAPIGDADFSAEELRKLLSKRAAFKGKDGHIGWPTPNSSYLNKAIQAWGRSNEKDRPALKRYLKRRARALGAGKDVGERIDNLSA